MTRRVETEALTTSCMVAIPKMGCSLSMEATTARTAETNAASSWPDFTSSVISLDGAWRNGRYTSRRAGLARPYILVSASTPTMVIHFGPLAAPRRPNAEPFADGVGAGKQTLREVGIDHRHERSVLAIRIREAAAAQEADTEGLLIFRADDVLVGMRETFPASARASLPR